MKRRPPVPPKTAKTPGLYPQIPSSVPTSSPGPTGIPTVLPTANPNPTKKSPESVATGSPPFPPSSSLLPSLPLPLPLPPHVGRNTLSVDGLNSSDGYYLAAQFSSPELLKFDGFASAIGIHNKTVFIGAPTKNVVYVHRPDVHDVFRLVQTLTPSDVTPHSSFGCSLSVSKHFRKSCHFTDIYIRMFIYGYFCYNYGDIMLSFIFIFIFILIFIFIFIFTFLSTIVLFDVFTFKTFWPWFPNLFIHVYCDFYFSQYQWLWVRVVIQNSLTDLALFTSTKNHRKGKNHGFGFTFFFRYCYWSSNFFEKNCVILFFNVT